MCMSECICVYLCVMGGQNTGENGHVCEGLYCVHA